MAKSKGSPFKPTVSIPICTKTSKPSLVVIPTACLESATIVILPETGATTFSLTGSKPKPSPIIPVEKTSSLVALSANTLPAAGETIFTFLAMFFPPENLFFFFS